MGGRWRWYEWLAPPSRPRGVGIWAWMGPERAGNAGARPNPSQKHHVGPPPCPNRLISVWVLAQPSLTPTRSPSSRTRPHPTMSTPPPPPHVVGGRGQGPGTWGLRGYKGPPRLGRGGTRLTTCMESRWRGGPGQLCPWCARQGRQGLAGHQGRSCLALLARFLTLSWLQVSHSMCQPAMHSLCSHLWLALCLGPPAGSGPLYM